MNRSRRAIATKNPKPVSGQTSVGTSYLLWLVCLFGVSGVHRFYNGKVGTGILWLITWGWFGFGQFIDLFLIPEMVDEHNLKRRSLLSGYYPGVGNTQPVAAVPKAEPTNGEMMMQLVQAANKYGGKLSVTQGVMATGLEFDKVEEVLSQMLKSGYVSIGNDPNSGVVIYDFHEL
ncbi:MAG: TM2 domain-containing protein [Cyanobacteria bacterium P01_C01_bin.89]